MSEDQQTTVLISLIRWLMTRLEERLGSPPLDRKPVE